MRDAAVRRAVQMEAQGAAIIDVGGESTRPGSEIVSLQEELDRVVPVVEKLYQELGAIISIDTCKPAVMQAAIAAGASIVNDIKALQVEGALSVIQQQGVAVCLMHLQGEPATMQHDPHYQNVVAEVHHFLQARVTACVAAGIAKEKIMIDPGFGFGKTAANNLLLLSHLEQLHKLQCPLLVGWSRKTTVGEVLKQPVEKRLSGSLAAAALAIHKGASIIRTHDVEETLDVINFSYAVLQSQL